MLFVVVCLLVFRLVILRVLRGLVFLVFAICILDLPFGLVQDGELTEPFGPGI